MSYDVINVVRISETECQVSLASNCLPADLLELETKTAGVTESVEAVYSCPDGVIVGGSAANPIIYCPWRGDLRQWVGDHWIACKKARRSVIRRAFRVAATCGDWRKNCVVIGDLADAVAGDGIWKH